MCPLSRRALFAGASAAALSLTLPSSASAQEVAYAAFRLVRARPGEPDQPEITLPQGYEFVLGAKYHAAGRAEYYSFVRGPRTPRGSRSP